MKKKPTLFFFFFFKVKGLYEEKPTLNYTLISPHKT